MQVRSRTRLSARLLAVAAVATALALLAAGCSDYLDRRDTLTRASGNAIATNIATQTPSRWPNAAWNRDANYDGVRMKGAIDSYRTRPPLDAAAQPATAGA